MIDESSAPRLQQLPDADKMLKYRNTATLRPHWLHCLRVAGWQAACILALLALSGLESAAYCGLRPPLLWVSAIWTAIMLAQLAHIATSIYKITPEQIKYYSGIVGRRCENIELYRIKDLSWKTSLLGRLLGVGDVVLRTTDFSRPRFAIPGVRNPEAVMQEVRDRVEINRIMKRAYEIIAR